VYTQEPLGEKQGLISGCETRIHPFSLLLGLVFIFSIGGIHGLQAQPQGEPAVHFVTTGQKGSSLAPDRILLVPSAPVFVQDQAGSAGLVIHATFDASIDAATQIAIQNAIAFYQNTFTNNLTVNIGFYSMGSGLGESLAPVYNVSYSSFRTALLSHASSSDDATALTNTPAGSTNPVNGSSMIGVRTANGRALGLSTPEVSFNFPGSPCPTLIGSGCIGINVTLANSLGNLTDVIEHEIDEILGLGSALQDVTTPSVPSVEDLFRWASPGTRSYSANASTTIPCGPPSAFFSIDGGATDLDEFNNCNNGGDYGDWIMHTPAQVQDAFSAGPASPLTITSSEVRALDVIGYSLPKRRRGQITSN
jgi:hypothetical protein